jgi:iron(III) transport system permease protein
MPYKLYGILNLFGSGSMQARLGASQFRRVRQFAQDPLLVTIFIVISIFVFLAVILPLTATVGLSVSEEGRPLFQRYIGDPTYQTIIMNTIVMGLLVAVLGTTVGFVFAFVQVKLDVPLKGFMHIVALLPVISPPFAVATAMIVLFGRNGMISRGIFGVRYDIYGLDGLTSVLALSFFTIAYLNLRGMMLALDPALDEASTSLGANKWRTFRKVTLPMLAPGIASSFLLLFVEAIADLGNPLVLGGNYEVLATRIYITIVGLYDPVGAAVLCVILLVPSLTVYLVQRYWISRASVVSVTGKPAGKPQTINQPLVRWGLFAIVMFICVLIVLLYATIIIGAFVKVPGVNETLTLEHFDFVINGLGRKAMEDTTRLSLIATPLAGLIGMIIAFLVARTRMPGRAALDFATMLGIAVPGTIIGIGYLLVYNNPITITLPIVGEITLIPKLTGGQGLLGGAVAIVLVYITRSIPAALRSGTSAIAQIDPTIEEASTSLGANSVRTFQRITLPLIRPAFLAGLIYAFARSMTTISAIVFLTTPQTKIMTQQILNEVENGRYGNAFAYCTLLIVIVLVAIGGMYLIIGSRTGAERAIESGAN